MLAGLSPQSTCSHFGCGPPTQTAPSLSSTCPSSHTWSLWLYKCWRWLMIKGALCHLIKGSQQVLNDARNLRLYSFVPICFMHRKFWSLAWATQCSLASHGISCKRSLGEGGWVIHSSLSHYESGWTADLQSIYPMVYYLYICLLTIYICCRPTRYWAWIKMCE